MNKVFFFFSTHHQVVLDLLIHAVKGSVSVDHDHLGFFVSPGPGCVLVCADVFVTQAQRPQGRIGKYLKYNTQTVFPCTEPRQKATYIDSTNSISAVPRQTEYISANEKKAMQTHVQRCLG